MQNTPNIFNYATSELSQDAFICWLLEWSMEEYKEENTDLHKAGYKFLKEILNKVRLSADSKIIEIKKQYKNIDILLILKDGNNQTKTIIIEDKTFTNEHSNQLKKYKNQMLGLSNKDNVEKNYICKEENLHMLFFKTGYMSDTEIAKYSNIEERTGCFSYKDIDYLFNRSNDKINSDIYNLWIENFNKTILAPINKSKNTNAYEDIISVINDSTNSYNKRALFENFLKSKEVSSCKMLENLTENIAFSKNNIKPEIVEIERKDLKLDLIEFYSHQADITFRYSFRYNIKGVIHFELTCIPGTDYMSQKEYIKKYGNSKNNQYIKQKEKVTQLIYKLKEEHNISGINIKTERLQTFKFVFKHNNLADWQNLNNHLPLLMNNLLESM